MLELEMQDRMELVKEAQDVVKSRFLLCILVTQRIHQLENGAQPTIEVDADEKLNNPKIFWFFMAASCSFFSRADDCFLLPLCSSSSIEI